MIERSEDWVSAQVGDELVMMNVTRGHYIGVNAIGARIWELLEQPRAFAALCTTLTGEFAVAPEICEAEVTAFLGELERYGAVSIHP